MFCFANLINSLVVSYFEMASHTSHHVKLFYYLAHFNISSGSLEVTFKRNNLSSRQSFYLTDFI